MREQGGEARGRAAKKKGEGKQERSMTQRGQRQMRGWEARRYPEKRKCRQIHVHYSLT